MVSSMPGMPVVPGEGPLHEGNEGVNGHVPDTDFLNVSDCTMEEFHDQGLGDASYTSFPRLTGLKPKSDTGKLEYITLESSLTLHELQTFAEITRASPIAILQLAWAAILSSYTDTPDDVMFDTIECTLGHGDIDQTDLDTCDVIQTRLHLGDGSVARILRFLTTENAKATPCDDSSAIPQRKLRSRSPTTVAFSQDILFEECKSKVKSNSRRVRGPEFLIGIEVWPSTTRLLKLRALYRDTHLNETGARLVLTQFESLSARILSDTSRSIASIVSTLPPSLLSVSWEETQNLPEDPTAPLLLHSQFESIAESNPDRVALLFREDLECDDSEFNVTWTYKDLNQKANRVANYLNGCFGDLIDCVVPICMERSPQLYVAILGVLKAGGAWCPIDPSFPAHRRQTLITRTGATMLLVADSGNAIDTSGIPEGIIPIDITRLDRTSAKQYERTGPTSENLAYLIWTSGTTGDPKGVPIHHGAAVTSMMALQSSIPVDVKGGVVRCLQFSQLTFDVFVQDLFYTWGVGGLIISSNKKNMLGSFPLLATKVRATHAHLTPAFAASIRREQCPHLEVVTMIGEKLPQTVADDWSQGMRAFNTYGPAETTVVSTIRRLSSDEDGFPSSNIGFPLPSMSTLVMHNGHPTMKNGIGELALSGIQLSKGYWKDPVGSSVKFVWNERYARHLYMTGDIVRQLYDGSLDFLGRKDDLIKIQGIRIELSEIAFTLRSCHPLVEQVEVQYMNRRDRPSNVIVAFLAVPHIDYTDDSLSSMGNDAIGICKIAQLHGQTLLPDYMVPSVFWVIEKIPQTSSAKVDRTALKNIYGSIDLGVWDSKLHSDQNFSVRTAAWTLQEIAVLECVSKITGASLESMSRLSKLSSVGLDSIGAARLVALLIDKGMSISMVDILKCQVVEELLNASINIVQLEQVERFDLEAFDQKWNTIIKAEIGDFDGSVVPALPFQESVISESMQDARNYWSHQFFVLDSCTDPLLWRNAWREVALHTESLRSGFLPTARLAGRGDSEIGSKQTFLQLIFRDPIMDWACVNSSETSWKNQARERAHEVINRHQSDHFKDPPWAITFLERESHPILMISIHHVIRDEISMDLIVSDVTQSLVRLSEPSSSLDQMHQRTNDSSNQRSQLRDAVRLVLPTDRQSCQDEEFWKTALEAYRDGGIVGTWPDLLGKHRPPHDANTGFIAHTQTFRMQFEDLQARAIKIGANSIVSVLRVAFGYMLLEYLETDRLVFAETYSARTLFPSLASAIAPLISVLPVPFRRNETFRDTLGRQADFQSSSRAHSMIHPRVIKKLLGRLENQSLFPAIFNIAPDPVDTDSCQIHRSCLWSRMEDFLGIFVEHPVAINFAQTTSGLLQMETLVSEAIMDTAHLGLFAQQTEALVAQILEHPDASTEQIGLHLPIDLLSMSSSRASDPMNEDLPNHPTHWVDHYFNTHPDWIAAQVVSEIDEQHVAFRSWNYAELHSAYNQVATYISASAVGSQMIAVCLDRRLDAFAIILGILKSGNTYLPIDEDLPMERKVFLLQDSAAILLFTTRSLLNTFAMIPSTCHIICIDEREAEGWSNDKVVVIDGKESSRASNHDNSISLAQPRDNAYLLYTSGSTGLPKGVLVSRANLCSFIEAASVFSCSHVSGMNELEGKGRCLGLASRAFDVHLIEMFLAWRQGMAIVTASRTMLLDNLELSLRKLDISHAFFVPSLIDQVSLSPAALPKLRYLSVGGEKISQNIIDTWASNPRVTLVNAYGPTEMTIGCAFNAMTPSTNVRNIGFPLGNTTAHVLVPGTEKYTMRGIPGELCFTGELVANGYHNRPDAQGFSDDFGGSKMYRTGDRVRMMANGSLEFLGRSDDQTKIRGQRLELGEVSQAIRASTSAVLKTDKVDVASMIAMHQALSRQQLVSFVAVPQYRAIDSPKGSPIISHNYKGLSEKIQDIKARCRDVLPSYMVPDHVIFITKLPLAQISGKADSKTLSALFSEISLSDLMSDSSVDVVEGAQSESREMTDSQNHVRDLVSETLNIEVESILLDTNLFRAGLDSLNVISLTVRLQRLGFDCSVTVVLQRPSVRSLALLPHTNQTCDARQEKIVKAAKTVSDLEARFRDTQRNGLEDNFVAAVRSCLPLQETLVAATLNNHSSLLYVNHIYLTLFANVDLERFRVAWIKVINEYDILRTCFQEFESRIVQVVLKSNGSHSIHWTKNSVTNINAESPAAQCFEEAETASEIVSKISYEAPIRFHLMHSSDKNENSILRVSLHHALYDRESLTMIFDEVYTRYTSDIMLPLRAPFSSLIHYVAAQDCQSARNFWEKYLADYRSAPVTVSMSRRDDDRPNLHTSYSTKRTISVQLSRLEERSSSLKVAVSSFIQGAFGLALAQLLGKNDVVFGVVLSGRSISIEEAHSILAPCITTIPQRFCLQQCHLNVLQSLLNADRGFVESLEYQHTSLRDIHRWARAEKPLFDTLFSYVHKEKPRPYSDLWRELEDSMPAEFPLAVEIEVDHEVNQIVAHCTFTSAFGDVHRADSFLERLDLLLIALVQTDDISLDDLNVEDSGTPYHVSESAVITHNDWEPEELRMRKLIADMCKISRADISRNASFFSLGIDSVTAIRFARQLRQIGLDCSSADVMRYPCISALVDYMKIHRPQTEQGSNFPPLKEDDRLKGVIGTVPILSPEDMVTDMFICSPLQSSMLTQTLASSGTLYFHHHAQRLSSEIDLTKLKNAWASLVARTEILRTTFHLNEDDSLWMAAVHKESSVKVNEYDSAFPKPESSTSPGLVPNNLVFRTEADFAKTPWTLGIWRGPKDVVLVLSIHHSLYDGLSINLIFQDLAMIYKGLDFPPRPPFSAAARKILKSSTSSEDFWVRTLSNYEGIGSRTVSSDAKVSSCEARTTFKRDIPSILADCKSLGVTLQTVALLAVVKGLASTLGRRDVVFGHVIGGRGLAMQDADEVVGPLFNTVPFRFDLRKIFMTNRRAVRKIQKFTSETQPYQHASLSKIQQAWHKGTSNNDSLLLDTLFVFQSMDRAQDSASSKLWTPFELPEAVTNTEHPLNIELEQSEQTLTLFAKSHQGSMEHERLSVWLAELANTIEEILEHPSQSVMDFPESLQSLPELSLKVGDKVFEKDEIEPGPDLDCLQDILAEVSKLPKERIRLNTGILSLGLDSIAAIQVAAKCRQKGYSVSVADVVKGRCLRNICRLLREKRLSVNDRVEPHDDRVSPEVRSKAAALLGVHPEDFEDILPCLAGQVYHIATWLKSDRSMAEPIWTYSCHERLNTDLLRAAWRLLRQRHSILRTAFVTSESKQVYQVVIEPSLVDDSSFQCIDIAGASANEPIDTYRQIANEPFDLFAAPCRLYLVRRKDQDCVMIKLHHAMYDAWTISTIVADLSALYQSIGLAPVPSFNAFVRHTVQALHREDQEAYWTKALRNAQPTFIKQSLTPNKSSSRLKPKPLFYTLKGAIPGLRDVTSTLQGSDISLPTLIILVFARVLARHTSIPNPTFGLYTTGRSTSFDSIHTLCAPCLNVTPLMIPDLPSDSIPKAVAQAALATQADLAARVPFEQSYLDDIFEWIGYAKRPLFNTYINILLHESSTTRFPSREENTLLVPWQLGSWEELLATSESMPGTTAVDALNTDILAEDNLYLDVIRCDQNDAVDFMVRCDGGLMNRDEVEGFIREIAREVKVFLEIIRDEGKKE